MHASGRSWLRMVLEHGSVEQRSVKPDHGGRPRGCRALQGYVPPASYRAAAPVHASSSLAEEHRALRPHHRLHRHAVDDACREFPDHVVLQALSFDAFEYVFEMYPC